MPHSGRRMLAWDNGDLDYSELEVYLAGLLQSQLAEG